MADNIVQLWNTEDEADGKAYPITIVDAIYDTSGHQLSMVSKYALTVTSTSKVVTIVKGGTGTYTVPAGDYQIQVFTSDGTMIIPDIKQTDISITLTFSEDITDGKAILIG